MSGGDLVLVHESAEDLFPADPVVGEVDLRWRGASLSRCELAEAFVDRATDASLSSDAVLLEIDRFG
jgi:hypothetical protein